MIEEWLAALEARHLADLRVAEVTRALRALSSTYVERRRPPGGRGGGGAVSGALDTAGKRAAFALFYAPLHFLTTGLVVRALAAGTPTPSTIVDAGCGTGAAGAAWALACEPVPEIVGIDRHPWAVDEARWTYRQLGLRGRARRGSVTSFPLPRPGSAIVAAYVLNELDDASRRIAEDTLVEAAARGVRVLVLEPIARSAAPWWDAAASRFRAAGGRADEWRFPAELPPLVRMFDKAAGLDHQVITVRSIYCPGSAPDPHAGPDVRGIVGESRPT